MKKKQSLITVFFGLLLTGAGLLLLKLLTNPQGFLLALPYIFIVLGIGVFGHGMGDVISRGKGS